MSSKDGGAAFPQLEVISCDRDGHGDLIEPFTSAQGGMSLRDWFAGMALQGMLTNNWASGDNWAESIAAMSYKMADAMLAEKAGRDE